MTNQLEEFIKEKTIRCAYGVKPFIAGEKYIAVEDLREFFKDKVIITVHNEDSNMEYFMELSNKDEPIKNKKP